MLYATSLPFQGKSARAFGLAESSLTALGFQITERSADSLEVTGAGRTRSKQSQIIGATRLRFDSRGGELSVEADLSEFVARFVVLFPLCLCLFLAVLFSVLFSILFGPGMWMQIVATVLAAIVLVWLPVGLFLGRLVRARNRRGVDTLLANMVVVGESAG